MEVSYPVISQIRSSTSTVKMRLLFALTIVVLVSTCLGDVVEEEKIIKQGDKVIDIKQTVNRGPNSLILVRRLISARQPTDVPRVHQVHENYCDWSPMAEMMSMIRSLLNMDRSGGPTHGRIVIFRRLPVNATSPFAQPENRTETISNTTQAEPETNTESPMEADFSAPRFVRFPQREDLKYTTTSSTPATESPIVTNEIDTE